ncbi:hypothetical protein Tco_0097009 [Tanacetum coccineum]
MAITSSTTIFAENLTSLSLDEFSGTQSSVNVSIKKDSEIVKAKVERNQFAFKVLRKNLVMKSVRLPVVKTKSTPWRCVDPNIYWRCSITTKDKNQRAFVGGSWSDSGEEDDEKVKMKYLGPDDDKLCKMSLKIITKNKRLKATRNSLENELRELKDKLSTLEKNKGVDLDCAKCHTLKIENEKLKEESTRLNKFEKSTHCLNEMLSNQKPSGDKLSLGFNSFEASSSGTKEIKFVKAQKKASSDGGPINMGGLQSDQAAPKIIMGPPPATPG